jgi:hypothetical protein
MLINDNLYIPGKSGIVFLQETFFYITVSICFLDNIAAKNVSLRHKESVVSD